MPVRLETLKTHSKVILRAAKAESIALPNRLAEKKAGMRQGL
jgi:hypothetical protein